MSTQHEIKKEAEALSRASPPLRQEQVFPGQSLPQPLQRPPSPKRNRWVVIVASVLMLALVVGLSILLIPGVMPQTPSSPGSKTTPTAAPTTVPTTPGPEISPTPAPPGVVLGPQACPDGIGDPAYWNANIGTNNGERQVESVSCANIMDNPSLQALVLVRHTNANHTLDVYVFNNITSSKPMRIFLLQGLIKGDAKISGYNTVMTAEVDTHSSLNADKLPSAMTPDLFREFDWSAEQNTLVQTAFPGLFPDLTRYQAEADQAQVNQGHQPWKMDPQAVAKAMATSFFDWKRSISTKLLSGGGLKDVSATVQVQEAGVQGAQSQGPSVMMTLSRLEGNIHNLWVVISVDDGSMLTLSNLDARSLVASPVTLEGTGAPFEAVIGRAVIYDHLYATVGQAQITGDRGMGKANYMTNVVYDTSFKAGPQEGIVAVYEANGGISEGIYTAVIRKALLSPQPRVAQGPVSCPIALQNSDYWQSTFGIAAGTVSCGNLKGDTSLQALVPVAPSEGTAGRIYVFDNLTGARPVQIFSMETGSSMISNTNTILTADTGANARNIYREFQWSEKAGTFVQVAFPGMYPDMTHWQAALDQLSVNQGKDSWKRDALQTATHFAATFFAGSTVTLVSGGGPRDLVAHVNLALSGGGTPRITNMTLNRLEGNTSGIWEVTAVGSNWLYISSPGSGTTISNPVTVKGFGPQFEAVIGTVYILDAQYQKIQIGDNFAMAPDGSSPPSPFSLDVKYTSSFQSGLQEGIVELIHSGGASFDSGVALTKVLISK